MGPGPVPGGPGPMPHTEEFEMPIRIVSRQYPKLKIWLPELQQFRQLEGGQLTVADDDPGLAELKAIAARKPYLEIRKVTGTTAEGNAISTVVKPAGDNICEACNPPVAFGSEAELAEHTADLHTDAPTLGADGEDTPATDRPTVRRGTVTSAGSRATRK